MGRANIRKNSVEFKVSAKEASGKLDKLSEAIEKQLRNVTIDATKMQRIVEMVGDEALAMTPKDTGELQNSQFRFVEQQGQIITGTVAYDLNEAPHGLFLHENLVHPNGTWSPGPNSPPRAQPNFLGRAVEIKTRQIARIAKGE